MATLATPAIAPAAYAEGGIWSWITTTDHKRIGTLYLFTALTFMLIGGAEAEIIRTQLHAPNQHFVAAHRVVLAISLPIGRQAYDSRLTTE